MQHQEVCTNLFQASKLNSMAPRHTFPACRLSVQSGRLSVQTAGRSGVKELKFGGSHALARLLTATLGISNSSYVEFNQISIWQFQMSEAFKPICFGPIVDSWIFSREQHLFLQKDSMNSRKEHSLHLLYTGHLVIRTSKAWRYNEIVLNQTN